jgi:glycosyltransferase involved in cell wall biosynthesis
MRVLYISHNGMLEGLGQSQVLAYLRGLARRGAEIDLLSYEHTPAEGAIEALQRTLVGSGVRWTPLRRARDTRLVVKVSESFLGVRRALAIALQRRPDIVHGRSYLPTAVSDLVASLVPRAKLVFDCRGMLGDEFVDAGHWTTDRLEYRLLKRYEARAFRRAEGVVVLTNSLKRWVDERRWFGARTQVAVIPCCVDLEAFQVQASTRARARAELGLGEKLVVVYSGSLGSWYRDSDIARFAGIVKKKTSRPVAFLLLTASPSDTLTALLRAEGFRDDELVVRRVPPSEMPAYLSAGDLAISFIKSCFSKTGSSPTKVAEYLACGLPVVLNGDIGDQQELAAERESCVVPRSFETSDLERAAEEMLALSMHPFEHRVAVCRAVARARFDLESIGVARYQGLYEAMLR